MECINQDLTAALDRKTASLRVTVNILPFTTFSRKITDISQDLFRCKKIVQHFL